MIEKDFVIGNFLDRITELETRMGELERRALMGTRVDEWVVEGELEVGVDVSVGGNVDVASNIEYDGNLVGVRGGVSYTGYTFVPLASPLTSTSWDGDSFSATAKTLIDLSSVFGVPGGIRAVLFEVSIRDSGSSGAGDYYLVLGPSNAAATGLWIDVNGLGNDELERGSLVVPCDANGDVYYEINASGAGTMDVWLRVWGYWI